MDHLTACDTFSLKRVRFLVLDEADRLIAGRFDSDLATIMGALPQRRQTLLFSATCNDTLRELESIANNEVGCWTQEALSCTNCLLTGRVGRDGLSAAPLQLHTTRLLPLCEILLHQPTCIFYFMHDIAFNVIIALHFPFCLVR